MFDFRGRGWTGDARGCAVLLGLLAGCAESPDDQPELRADGPPDVLAVLTAIDRALPNMELLEEATYCRPDDSKRPNQVPLPNQTIAQVCPDDIGLQVQMVNHASPARWYARIVFDELLDLKKTMEPGEEPLAVTGPVSLRCDGADVPVLSFYIAEGNKESWPPGPSIKVRPQMPGDLPANALCEVTLDDGAIRDKTGVSPEASQLGPYRFRLAPIGLLIPPGPLANFFGTFGTIPTLGVGNPAFRINFNHRLVASSFDAADVKVFRDATINDPATPLTDCNGGAEVAARVTSVEVLPEERATASSSMTLADATAADGAWSPGTQYRVEIGGGEVADQLGGSNVLERTTLCFRTR